MARPETLRYVYVNVNHAESHSAILRRRGCRDLQLEAPPAVALDERDLGQHRVDVLALLVEHRAPVSEHLQELASCGRSLPAVA